MKNSRAEAVNSQSLTFQTDYTSTSCIFMPFVDIAIKCQSNSEGYDQHGLFGTKFRGGQNFLFSMGGFPNERECSGAD